MSFMIFEETVRKKNQNGISVSGFLARLSSFSLSLDRNKGATTYFAGFYIHSTNILKAIYSRFINYLVALYGLPRPLQKFYVSIVTKWSDIYVH